MLEQKINKLTGKRMLRVIGGQKGYTLVEIVIVIVILGIIGAFTFQFVAHGVLAFKKSSARKDLYDQGRLALERMVRELRDGKEITDCSPNSITFKKAHPAQAADNIEEVKFELVGTDLKRVGDPSGTPQTAILATNVTSFQVGEAGGGSVTVDASSSGSANGAAGITISHTTGSGSDRLMLVGVSINNNNNETVTSVIYNGTSLTKVGEINNSNDARTEIWSLIAPDTGTHNVVITFSATLNQEAVAGVVTFNGVDQTAPLGTFASVLADDSTTAALNIPSDSGELVFGVVSVEYDAVTASSGQTEHWNIGVPQTYGAGGTYAGASPNVTMSWDLVVDSPVYNHWSMGGVSIKPSDSGPDLCTGGGGVISFDNASSSAVQYTNTLTFSHVIGSDSSRMLIATVSIEHSASTPTVTGITYDGQALTHAVSTDITSANDVRGRSELWYLPEAGLPSAGSYNVVVTASASTDEIIAGAISLNDVAQQAPEAINTSTNETIDAISVNVTTLTDGAWVVDSVHCGEPGSYTADAGQTERYDLQGVGTTSTHAASTKEVATAGSTTVGETYATGANRQAYVAAAFAPLTASSPLKTLSLTLSSEQGGTVTMRTKVFMRNIPPT
jgi:prepilin-type N-terminal cleavage/methylation domain-containing protein